MKQRAWFYTILLFAVASASDENNEVEPYEDPNTAVEGVWTECVAGLSFTCVQRKTLSFIDRLGRADKVPLLGGLLTLVRTGESPSLGRSIEAIDDTETLGRLVDQAIDSFFDTHVIRFTTPRFLSHDGRSSNTVDFNVEEIDSFEGRKGGGGHGGGGGGHGGGGKRGMKKMMMMMCMMMVGKMMMMGPLMLGLTKIIALKALLLGSISLLISKIMILKKLKMGGGLGGGTGGGGGGWSSGGGGGGGGGWQSGGSGGGWDRAAHNIAYSAYASSE